MEMRESGLAARRAGRRLAGLSLALTLVVGLWPARPAQAQGTSAAVSAAVLPRFAVFSEMGRTISVVQMRSTIGSRLDSNVTSTVPISDGTFDRMALTLVRQAVQRNRPASSVMLIAPLDADLFPTLVDPAPGARLPMADDLAQVLRDKGSTHLLLVTAQRSEAAFKFANNTIGTGYIRGLGFYVDPETEVRDLTTQQTRAGFLAPFAHFRLSLIEVDSGKLLASRPVLKHSIVSVAGADTPVQGAWSAMTSQQKVAALRELIEEGVAEGVKDLLAAI